MDEEKTNEETTVEEAATETPVEETAAEMPEEKPRHALFIKMQEMHPDVDDDEELLNRAYKHISTLEDYHSRNEMSNQELIRIARLHPVIVKILQMIKEGASPEEAIARNVDLSALPQEGDPDYEKWSAASKAREDDYAKSMEYETTLAENKAKSLQNLRDFAAENNMSEEQAMQFVEQNVSPLLEKIANLDISIDFLKAVHRLSNIDNEVATARDESYRDGRNDKIQEEIIPELPKGDGLPSASSAISKEKPAQKQSYIDYLKS